MKNLISYIQEKFLIDIDTDVNKCDNIDDLLSIYKLKKVKSNINDSESFSRIILKCSKDVFNIYI